MTAHAAVRPIIQRRLSAGGFAGFLLLGAVAALYGPTLPALRDHFGVSTGTAGLLLGAHFAGSVVGTLLAGAIPARSGARMRLALPAILFATGCTALVLAPTWPAAVAAATLTGMGFGSLDLGLNLLFSSGFGPRSAFLLNLVSSAFGIGAIAGPVAAGWWPHDFRPPFLVAAALIALLVPAFLAATLPATPPGGEGKAGSVGRRPVPALPVFLLLYMTYVALEQGVGGWEPTHLRDTLGVSVEASARYTALFWAAFTAGRLAAAPLSMRFPPAQLVAASLLLSGASVGLALHPPAAPLAYAMAGFFMAPVFPTGLAWLAVVAPRAGATALVMAGSSLGPVVLSPVIGRMVDAYGSHAIPFALAGTAALGAALTAALALLARTRS